MDSDKLMAILGAVIQILTLFGVIHVNAKVPPKQ